MRMNDFDGFSGNMTGSFSSFDPQPVQPSKPVAQGWHWMLSLFSFVLVAGLSFLMAFLTRNVAERPIWLMGLIFMVPAGAMFLAALILEFSTGAMTPAIIRGAQVKIAALAIAGTLLVGCVCDAIYLHGGFVGDSADNLVFLVYERNPTVNSPTNQAVMKVMEDLHKRSGDKVQVGLYLFDFRNNVNNNEKKDSVVEMAPFTQEQHQKMYEALVLGKKGDTVGYGHERAYEMVEASGTDRPTRIIFICESGITYGTASYTQKEWDRDLARLAQSNISIYFMGHGKPNDGMYYMAEHSGGKVITEYGADSILDQLQAITKSEGDMLRANTRSAAVLTGIMLAMEGIVIGLGLMLLLSVQGQKRFQVILSPLMAIGAFLLLKVLPVQGLVPGWMLEGAAFSLLGVVFMKRNYRGKEANTPVRPPQMGNGSFDGGNTSGDFTW